MKKTLTVDARTSSTSGATLYRVKKPGFQHDLFLSKQELAQLINELKRLGAL